MTYNANSLRLIESFGSTGNKAQGLYGYATNDTKASIEGAGYFNASASLLKVGDQIHVSGDLDGTPFHTSYVVSSNNGTTVAITEHSAVTQNVLQVLTVRVPVLGTASTHYVMNPVAGAISKVLGVSNANGATSTGTVTITVPTTGAIATLPFTSGYTAGTKIEDTTITAHTLAADSVITVATDGGGDGTGEVIVTLVVTPS
ncbi:MAG: hypothetical protein ACK502_10800 [Alphaproteobacteria bacterium]|jgi:hypothetical protein